MSEHEKKSLAVVIKDADKGEIRAVFSTFDVIDADGDVTLSGAFEDGANVRLSAYGHGSWHGELPIGRGKIRTDEKQAVFDGQFFMSTLRGKETFTTVKELGELGEWSYAYDVVESEQGEFNEQPVRFLKKLKVLEVSPVLVGAGVDTRTLSVKELKDLTKQGFEVQTLIFPKEKWDDLAAVKAWAKDHDFSSGNVDETENSWRLRQRNPDDFTRLRTICLAPSRDTAPEDCRVKAVGGPVRASSSREGEETRTLAIVEAVRFERTRMKIAAL